MARHQVRFAFAVFAAALAQTVVLTQLPAVDARGAALALAYVTLAAFGAGFFARRGAALAGALSLLVAALAIAADPRSLVLGVPLAGVAGAIGGWTRWRMLERAR